MVHVLIYEDYDMTRCIGVFSTAQKARAFTRKIVYKYVREMMETRRNHDRTVNYRTLREHMMEMFSFHQVKYTKIDSPEICDVVYSVV